MAPGINPADHEAIGDDIVIILVPLT